MIRKGKTSQKDYGILYLGTNPTKYVQDLSLKTKTVMKEMKKKTLKMYRYAIYIFYCLKFFGAVGARSLT